jgi:hypothetical protein
MVEVHPSKELLPSGSSRKDRSSLVVHTLEDLLSYTDDDSREDAFEAAVFAELFREMLELRFGRGILRAAAVVEQQEREVGTPV